MTLRPFILQDPARQRTARETLEQDLNRYAGRGFPDGVSLGDAHPDLRARPSGVLWGTTNTTSFAAGMANQSDISTPPTVAVARDKIVAVPFFHDVAWGIGGVGLRVTTGVASSKAMFGIYDSLDDGRGNFYPGKKLWGSSEITPTANNTSHEQAPNLSLPVGRWYWLVYTCGNASGPTTVALPVAATMGILGYSTGTGAPTNQTYLSGARTYDSTLPSMYPSGQTAVATTAPLLWYWYNPSLTQTLSKAFPLWSPPSDGYVLRSMRLLSGDTIRSGSGRPSVKIKARIVTANGADVIGTFDSTQNVVAPGAPFYLTGAAPIDRTVPKDAVIDVLVEQTGWPLLSVQGCRVCCEYARTGA